MCRKPVACFVALAPPIAMSVAWPQVGEPVSMSDLEAPAPYLRRASETNELQSNALALFVAVVLARTVGFGLRCKA